MNIFTVWLKQKFNFSYLLLIQGDSGGPLVHEGVIYGITSFGGSVSCEDGVPVAFTRVSQYKDWIETFTGNLD